MEIDWLQLLRALALVPIIEGIGPFLAPARWRGLMIGASGLDDGKLRTLGLVSMVCGVLFLSLLPSR